VHDDVQLFQWLIADDGHIKMNDFNRAEVRGRSVQYLPSRTIFFGSAALTLLSTSLWSTTKSTRSTANTRTVLDQGM